LAIPPPTRGDQITPASGRRSDSRRGELARAGVSGSAQRRRRIGPASQKNQKGVTHAARACRTCQDSATGTDLDDFRARSAQLDQDGRQQGHSKTTTTRGQLATNGSTSARAPRMRGLISARNRLSANPRKGYEGPSPGLPGPALRRPTIKRRTLTSRAARKGVSFCCGRSWLQPRANGLPAPAPQSRGFFSAHAAGG
jgi:hypothetical protein